MIVFDINSNLNHLRPSFNSINTTNKSSTTSTITDVSDPGAESREFGDIFMVNINKLYIYIKLSSYWVEGEPLRGFCSKYCMKFFTA